MPPDVHPVQLVGAGPGAVDLLTLRAARAIGEAEALLYDALVADEVVALAPATCLKIRTGKRRGRASMAQATINRLMLRLARRGLRVVRLKGGDPSIFGRVGEEVEFLEANGIAAEVIPGVTAACAAAAQFSFPLTHRREARRVTFSTATLEAGASQLDWTVAADPQTTLAVYMGAAEAIRLSERLIAQGRSAATPVAVIERAGSPDARLRTGVLATLGALVEGLGQNLGPVLIVVGETAARAQSKSASNASLSSGVLAPRSRA